jgi:hypothetical protein
VAAARRWATAAGMVPLKRPSIRSDTRTDLSLGPDPSQQPRQLCASPIQGEPRPLTAGLARKISGSALLPAQASCRRAAASLPDRLVALPTGTWRLHPVAGWLHRRAGVSLTGR